MPLRKKIVIGFLLSAGIVAALAVFEYVNFLRIRDEIRFLETTDTLRSKSLQLRRYEKNFFLKNDFEEAGRARDYIGQIRSIIDESSPMERAGAFAAFRVKTDEYAGHFNRIELLARDFSVEFSALRPNHRAHRHLFAIIEATYLERPLVNARLMKDLFGLRDSDRLIALLDELSREISSLRLAGDGMITLSKELDGAAREKVDGFIRMSQIAILIVFPVFLAVGFGTILVIIGGVVTRLRLLASLVDEAGRGAFTSRSPSRDWGTDEVGQLIRRFVEMEEQLTQREQELLRSKKLAAIGTFSSGVAHELNNPLNNIYTTAQRVIRRAGNDLPPQLRQGLDDIFGQTMRVKGIVSDLLEFARGREPNMMAVELGGLVRSAYAHLSASRDLGAVDFRLEFTPREIVCFADTEQLERVFVNLFSNAVDAMDESGSLCVTAVEGEINVVITVADTGRGIPREALEKIFEPFFTTRHKGTGLGLAIVFSIIQKHGGEVRVESSEGLGTAFVITLPKNRQAGTIDRQPPERIDY